MSSTFILLYSIFGACMVGSVVVVLMIFWLATRGRMRIRVKTGLGEKEVFRKPEFNGKEVIIFKENTRKNRPAWILKFSTKAVYWTRKFFRNLRTLDCYPDALEAIEWDHDLKRVEQPKFSKREASIWLKSEALRVYAEGLEQKMKMFQILTLVLVIVNIAITFVLLARFI